MKVKVTKIRTADQIVELQKSFSEKYGTLSSLSQKVSFTKCASKDQMNNLIIWKYLNEGAELKEEIIFENSEIFDMLSPRRIELMEFLVKNEVTSIRKLAEMLHRNYKNVYDDLKALHSFGIIEFQTSGRSRKPICSVININTIFED